MFTTLALGEVYESRDVNETTLNISVQLVMDKPQYHS